MHDFTPGNGAVGLTLVNQKLVLLKILALRKYSYFI